MGGSPRPGNRVFPARLEATGEGRGQCRWGARFVPYSRGRVAYAHPGSFNSAHRCPHPHLLLELKFRFAPRRRDGCGGAGRAVGRFLLLRSARGGWNAFAPACLPPISNRKKGKNVPGLGVLNTYIYSKATVKRTFETEADQGAATPGIGSRSEPLIYCTSTPQPFTQERNCFMAE